MQFDHKVKLKPVSGVGCFSSWGMGMAGCGARHSGHGPCCVRQPSPGPGKRFTLGILRVGMVQLVLSEVGGFGLFFCSLLLGLGERKQRLLAAMKLDTWQIIPIYTVKKPKGAEQQTGGQETGAAEAEQPHCVFLPVHLLPQHSGEVVCRRAVFRFDGFWHPFQHLEEG